MAAAAAATAADGACGERGSGGPIDLRRGTPDDASLPYSLITSTVAQLLQRESTAVPQNEYQSLQYGDDPLAFTAPLASFLTRHYGCAVHPEHLYPACGVSHAIDLAAAAAGPAAAGDVALCQSPSYFLSFSILADRGYDVVALDEASGVCDGTAVYVTGSYHTHGGGDDTTAGVPSVAWQLEEATRRLAQQGRRVRLLYLVPTHTNPTGETIGQGDREALVEAAERLDVTIIADEVYHCLHWGGAPLPQPMACVRGGSSKVISVASFSKVLCPGIRVGWVHCADGGVVARVRRSGVFVSGGVGCQFTSRVVAHTITSGALDTHLEQVKRELAAKAAALTRALRVHLPEGCTFHTPSGGYFIWVDVDGGGGDNGSATTDQRTSLTAAQLLETCRESVTFLPGPTCTVEGWRGGGGGGARACAWRARLCFAKASVEALEEGARRLGAAISASRAGASGVRGR